MPPSSKISALHKRAAMFAKARDFFHQRAILEVDCPLITQACSVDAHIDLIPIWDGKGWRYLHSSPEYGMKRLLSLGIGDIYQLNHVFRQGELSEKHNPEFTMAEWYRLGISFEALIQETVDFVRLFLGDLSYQTISYRDVFLQHAGIDYVNASSQELLNFLKERNIELYAGIEEEGKDALLNIILGTFVEPHLGQGKLTVLAYYPASQAALAKTKQLQGELVAERFEIYYKGIELANGYHELVDPIEQRQRLIDANEHRQRLGKEMLPIDEKFLQALEAGIPDACGVAVGFDRLMMLLLDSPISGVLPFDWNNA